MLKQVKLELMVEMLDSRCATGLLFITHFLGLSSLVFAGVRSTSKTV